MTLNMKLKSLLNPILLAVLVALPAGLIAADKSAPAKQPDNYPLKTCVVSDEPLGSMGEYVNYVHKEAGKPDRVIRFCCDGCIDDFKKEPAKFLAKLDAAAKANGGKKADDKSSSGKSK
jgi:hypothetical protein